MRMTQALLQAYNERMDKETKEAILEELNTCQQDLKRVAQVATDIQLNNAELRDDTYEFLQAMGLVQSKLQHLISRTKRS